MKGQGAARRERLVRAAGLARKLGMGGTRAGRLSLRLAGKTVEPPPSFSELQDWPDWPACHERAQALVFSVAALLASGVALREEISGAVLRGIAERVGHDLLEQVLVAPETGRLPLPGPEELEAAGREMALAALPRRLAGPMGHSPAEDGAGNGGFVAEAERLVRPAMSGPEAA